MSPMTPAFPTATGARPNFPTRVVGLVGRLIERFAPAAAVIACNTASTLVLPPLRERHAIPFIGTVPAIKPAAERTKSGLVSVLATFGTMKRDYTRSLIESFARSCHVRLVGSSNLAPLAEAHMRGEPVGDAAILAEIAPAFMEEDGRRTDQIVLACTHYPFLLAEFRRLAPWPVEWIDPAPAIARRVAQVTGDVLTGNGGGEAYLSSGKAWPAGVEEVLHAIGIEPAAGRTALTRLRA